MALPASTWREIALGVLFLASLTGFLAPKLLVFVGMSRKGFSVLKGFSAGVIIGVALLHLLKDSISFLTEYTSYSLGLAMAGVGMFVSFILDQISKEMMHRLPHTDDYYVLPTEIPLSTSSSPDATVIDVSNNGDEFVDLMVALKKAVVLELTCAIHSIIIGFNVGAMTDSSQIKILMFALIFHQFFEGNALGSYCEESKFSVLSSAVFGLIFSLSLPFGIIIGLFTAHADSALVVQGCANGVAAGMLIYTALVELLQDDFSEAHVRNNSWLKVAMVFASVMGYSALSFIAVYA